MKLEQAVPVGRPVVTHGSRPMHWLVPRLDGGEGWQTKCAGQDATTPVPAVREYDGFVEAITCRFCRGARLRALRADAVAYFLEFAKSLDSLTDYDTVTEALHHLGVADKEMREP